MPSTKETSELYDYIFKLKRLDRLGWTKYDINKPESVAEHSFGLAILALSLAPKLNLDSEKAVKIALIHDLGESIIGDIQSPENKKDKAAKRNLEEPAITKVLSLFDSSSLELKKLWDEFEEGSTLEANFVKELDKIEMCLQALKYEEEQNVSLDEFFEHTRSRLTIPELTLIFNKILESRNKSN